MPRVEAVFGEDLREPLKLLEDFLRGGETLPENFVLALERSIDAGDMEVLAARTDDHIVGVLVLDYRLNVSLGGPFASIEDLYVEPEQRRRGVGRALLEEAGRRCVERGISYVEVQAEDDEAVEFYVGLGFEEEDYVRVLGRSRLL